MNDPNDPNDPRSSFVRRCDTIEEAYEFMLAYAAQGLSGDAGSQSGGQVREFLTRAAAALTGMGDVLTAVIEQERLEPADRYRAYVAVLDRDARDSLAAVELVLAQPSISSQLVDNLNASIHLRALLTDLFLIDEVLKTRHVHIDDR
ncbi:MAG: hypothetical protein ACRD3C_03455 [Vicinamibacterales bacterium]